MKKIYRKPRNGMIFGICAGIADEFNIDVTIVRLIAVFAGVVTSVFPLAITYIVGYFVIPEKEETVTPKE